MYLSKIEIFGFKSFANKTVINLNRGVTGVVGPNGCGKSNVVDALRWVIGEQRASVLRSDKMESVIFNGTKDRKPLGMAEVSLTIVNDRGLLPSEYSEITITRRIYRSGESEYLLNKNVCRYKDIVGLFMDTGMSTNAYSVIELKMVEAVIGNKVDERRNMFEEAAGVSKFKLRKRLTIKKLEEVRSDLVRVDDILSEVQRKVMSLERQAKKADKWNQIKNELKDKEINLAEHEYAFFHKKKQDLLTEREFDKRERVRLEEEINALEDQIADDRYELDEMESKLSSIKTEVTQVTERIYKLEQQISVSEERKKSVDRNIDRLTSEIEELKSDIDFNNDLITDLESKIEDINLEIKQNEQSITDETDSIASKKEAIALKKEDVVRFREESLTRFKEISQKENAVSNLKKQLNDRSKGLNSLLQNRETLENKLNEANSEIEKLESENNKKQNILVEQQENLTNIELSIEEKKAEHSKFVEKEYEKKSHLNSLEQKAEFINAFLSNLDNVSKGTKALLNDEEWQKNKLNLISNIVDSEEEYRLALETALENVLNFVFVSETDKLQEAVDYLRDKDLGKASILLGDNPKESQGKLLTFLENYVHKSIRKKVTNDGLFVSFADTFVKSENEFAEFFKEYLKNTIVVKSFEDALNGYKKYKNYNFVTLEGDYIDATGRIIAGSKTKIEDTLLGKHKLLENIKIEADLTATEIEEISVQLHNINNEIMQLEGRKIALEKEVKDNQKKLFDIERNLTNLSAKKENIQNDYSKNIERFKSYEDEINDITAKLSVSENELNTLVEQKNEFENTLKSSETDIHELEDELNNFVSEISNKRIAHEKIKAQKKDYESQLERAQDDIEDGKSEIESKEAEIERYKEEANSIDILSDDNYIQIDELHDKRETLSRSEYALNDSMKDIKTKVSEFDTKIRTLRKQKDEVADRLRDYDVTLTQVDMKIKSLVENIKLEYELTLEIKDFEDLESFDYDTINEEVFSLKQQIKNIGPVNTLAYEEWDEEKQRLDFMTKQRVDLMESEKDLINTIEEINTTATQQFLETFEKIRENFITIFRGLFNPGDEADLRLEEGVDPLEAKIEIIAKPKGKRPTSISLLSGGEKTLTATALLFAIYMIKPSPYCVMDEVDAPLDDANVGRFTRIIHQFKDKTQFIIVTHNKKTMEAAETMYGVTMQDEGISKIVSVQFGDELRVV